MKTLRNIVATFLLLLFPLMASADSVLTSTDFYKCYEDELIMSEVDPNQGVTQEVANYLFNPYNPIDVKMAVVNKLSWNINGTSFALDYAEFLRYKYDTRNNATILKKLDSEQLIIYAYMLAMSNYFDVKKAVEIAQMAVKKNDKKSFTVEFIASLIEAQNYMDSDWSKIYPTVNSVLMKQNLHRDMRQSAINVVMEYVKLYNN